MLKIDPGSWPHRSACAEGQWRKACSAWAQGLSVGPALQFSGWLPKGERARDKLGFGINR